MSEELMGDFAAMMGAGILAPEDIGMDPLMVAAIGGGDFGAALFGGYGGGGYGDDDESERDEYNGGTRPITGLKDKQPRSVGAFCEVCNVAVQPANMDQHYQGRKHQKAVEKQQNSQLPGTKRGNDAVTQPHGGDQLRQPARTQPAAAAGQLGVRPFDSDYPHLHESLKGDYGMTRGADFRGVPVHKATTDADLAKLHGADVRVLLLSGDCSNQGLAALVPHAPHLQQLQLRRCRVTASGLVEAATRCPLIEVLDIAEVMGLDRQATVALLRHLPRLKYMDIRDTQFHSRLASECPPTFDYRKTHPNLLLDL